MRIVKWVGLGLLVLLVLVVAFNWTTIQRLRTVNSLFDADKIVENFSSMDAAFLHHDLKIGEPQPWEEDIQDIPETVMLAGKEVSLKDALTELDTTALVIIRDGKLIHESYYKGTERDDLRISWSVAKSFMSGLYGQAIENGLMDISNPIEFYLPQLKGTAYEGASVDDILNMTSGVRFNEDYLDPKSDINDMGRVLGLGGSMDDYTETLLDRQYEPGTTWQYVSIDTHVAAMALRKVTGKSLHQLWEETYGAHLGMGKSPFYLTDGEDVAFALGGLNLRTRDYAKFGQLFLQGGEWEGEQLIPADWVAASTKNQAPNVHPIRGTGYGYQWWVPMPQEGPSKGDFFAVGIYGQYVYVNPAAGIVIAKNAADREFTFEQSNGQHSMNMNIDMFRSLAEQLKPNTGICVSDMTSKERLVYDEITSHRRGRIRFDAKRVNTSSDPENICLDPELWGLIYRTQAGEYKASCEQAPEWTCSLEKEIDGVTSEIDISGIVDSALAGVGVDDGYDKVKVRNITTRVDITKVWVVVNIHVWKDGKRHSGRRTLLIVDDIVQQQ